MLISFPFLPQADAVTKVLPIEVTSNDDCVIPLFGVYPITKKRCWHGGVHLHPQKINQPVRAIADGTVVAYRQSAPVVLRGSEDDDDDFDDDHVNAANPGDDNSFILLRHETETGKGRTIRFYSLYMHLAHVEKLNPRLRQLIHPLMREPKELTVDGKTKVYRKDILGYCGKFSVHTMIHMEVFMTDADFQDYFQHTQLGNANITQNGDTELWGDQYLIVPAGQRWFDPKTGNFAGTLEKRLFVRVRYDQGNRIITVWQDQGPDESPTLITYEPAKEFLGDDKPDYVEKRYEYKLYDTAVKRYPACPSAGYELLRFGRMIGPDKDKLNAQQSRNLQTIVIASNQLGQVDVSSPDIIKLSDADFPWFMNWGKISEGDGTYAADGLCDVKEILRHIKKAQHVDHPRETQESLTAGLHLHDPSVHKLRGLICEAPTEWEQSTNATRYARLLEEGQTYDGKPERYEHFLRYVEQFQFWDKTGLPTKVWHIHPLAFIEHFRKCPWLSEKEFKQLLPRMVLRKDKTGWKWEKVPDSYANEKINKVFTIHRPQLNAALRKYGIDTPRRMAAFFGNSVQETQWWGKLHEEATKAWYYPWDGRGFLQLTHVANYMKYWKFRGRHIDAQVEASLLDAAKKAKDQHNKNMEKLNKEPDLVKRAILEKTLPTPNRHLKDEVSGVTLQMKDRRSRVHGELDIDSQNSEGRMAPSDSAGVYWAWMHMAQYGDGNIVFERQTISTQAGVKIYYRSEAFWKATACVNLPAKIDFKYHHYLNGFVDRCVAWAQALAVLTETRFPDAKGMSTLDYPEGHEPRRD